MKKKLPNIGDPLDSGGWEFCHPQTSNLWWWDAGSAIIIRNFGTILILLSPPIQVLFYLKSTTGWPGKGRN